LLLPVGLSIVVVVVAADAVVVVAADAVVVAVYSILWKSNRICFSLLCLFEKNNRMDPIEKSMI
jgi:hypothetical protein